MANEPGPNQTTHTETPRPETWDQTWLKQLKAAREVASAIALTAIVIISYIAAVFWNGQSKFVPELKAAPAVTEDTKSVRADGRLEIVLSGEVQPATTTPQQAEVVYTYYIPPTGQATLILPPLKQPVNIRLVPLSAAAEPVRPATIPTGGQSR